MPSDFNYAGTFIEEFAASWDVQRECHAVLELDVERLGIAPPSSGLRPQRVLTLSIADIPTIPSREVETASLPFINGNNYHTTRPRELQAITVNFRDFIRAGTRHILQKWFDLTYDERTGLMMPGSLAKIDGSYVMFGPDGKNERTAVWKGCQIVKGPQVVLRYNSGAAVIMACDIKVDRIIWNESLRSPVS